MDSLSILIPEPSSADEPQHSSRASTGGYLESVTAQLIRHINRHEWDHPDFQTYMDPNFTAYLEYQDQPVARSLHQFLTHYKAFVDANPGYAIEPISFSADVNETKGLAMVWMHLRVLGHPANFRRESVTVAYWKRRRGKWTSYGQNGIRGVGWDL